MSIIKWFNKPKWQSPNEQVRITAIQSSQDPELIIQLLSIVNDDASEKVQIAALNKMTNHTEVNTIIHNHPNKKIHTIAKKKLLAWMINKPNELQQQVFSQIKDHELIQAIAQDAADSSIKLQAINQISQQGFLGDLLLKETNQEVQNALLQQITQESTIQRLIEQLHKKNRKLKVLLEQKLSSNDNLIHEQKALELCQKLEAVVHGKSQQAVDLDVTDQQWQQLQNNLSENLKLRFTGAFQAAKMILDPKHRTEFLQKQKTQRYLSSLTDIEQTIANSNNSSLLQIQSLIDKLNVIDTTVLSASDNNRLEELQANLITQREQVQQEQKIPDAAIAVVEQLNLVLNQPTAAPQQLSQYKSQWQKVTKKINSSEAFTQLTDQFQQLCLKLAEKIEQSAELRNQAALKAVSLIEKACSLIDEGQLAQAKITSNEIAKNKQLAGYSHPVIKNNKYQLDQVWTRLKELRDWQKWSNDKARQDIINSLVNIHGQGLHPDAVLKKLKDSNDQWYALEDMEKLAGDKFPSRNQAMWLEFRKVSKAIFEPTQPFFEKRSEQQSNRLDEIKNLMAEMDAYDLSTAAESDLAKVSRNGMNELKSLDQLPPKQRGMMARKLRKSISRIDNKLNEFYQDAESKKLKLIEQAQALHESEDINEAINTAKSLQQQWKTAGIVKQFTERKLWKKFRKANDALFNKRDQAQKADKDSYQLQQKGMKTFIARQTKLLKTIKTEEYIQQFKVETLKEWDLLEKSTNFTSIELNQLLQQADEKIIALKHKVHLQKMDVKEQIDQLYSQFEQGKVDEVKFNQQLSDIADDALKSAFEPRTQSNDVTEETLNQHLIEAEFITGLSTPEEFMEQRMAYQVQMLSLRMSGEKSLQDNEQAKQLLEGWFLLPKSSQSFMKKHSKRINQVVSALKKLAFE